MSINLKQALIIAEAARQKAQEIGVPMNIAIADDGANIKLFIRMDEALLGSGDIAIKKARASSLFEINSGEIGKQSQPGGALFNIELTNGGVVSFPGGIVLKNKFGKTVGAIGVSGGEVDEDFTVASSGEAAFKE